MAWLQLRNLIMSKGSKRNYKLEFQSPAQVLTRLTLISSQRFKIKISICSCGRKKFSKLRSMKRVSAFFYM